MDEKQQQEFYVLLKMFIEDCGLDRIEACKKATELLAIIEE